MLTSLEQHFNIINDKDGIGRSMQGFAKDKPRQFTTGQVQCLQTPYQIIGIRGSHREMRRGRRTLFASAK